MTQIIEKQLDKIEKLLNDHALMSKPILTLDEACTYTCISKSTMYKLTSKRKVPHFKPLGKLNYFLRTDLDKWLLTNRQSTSEEIGQNVNYSITGKGGNDE